LDNAKLSAFHVLATCLESEVLLGKIAERHHDDGCQHFGHSWKNMEVFNEELDKNIIQVHANQHQDEITQELDAASQDGPGENDKAVQQVTGGKAYCKRHEEGRNMRADGSQGCKNDLFSQNEIVRQEVKKNVEKGISTSACCVAECLNRHQLPERNV
jgi:hypothetical protein